MSYLRGSAAYLLVADGMRRATLDKAVELQQKAENEIGKLPFTLLINKLDVIDDWEIKESDLAPLSQAGWRVVATSAKTGVGVQETFLALAQKLLEG
jgi:GTPase SAR1 family protein